MKNRRRYSTQNSPLSLWAVAMLAIILGLPILAGYSASGNSMPEMISNIVDLVPFGSAFCQAAVKIVNSLFGQAISYNTVKNGITLVDILSETAKLLFTGILFEAMNSVLPRLFSLEPPRGIWNKAKKIVLLLFESMIAACISPMLLNVIFNNWSSLSSFVAGLISTLLTVILVGGGIAFFTLLKGMAIGLTIGYVAVKYLLMNVVKLSACYIFLFTLLIELGSGSILRTATGAAGFLGVLLMLCGAELIIDAAFN